jgi:phage terminase large subunit
VARGLGAVTNPFVEFQELYGNDPVRFAREVLGFEPDEQQQAVMNEVVHGTGAGKGRRISIRSGHGTGKTCTLSVIIVWHFCCKPDQITLVTAPTSTQLFDALAAQTKSWFRKLPAVWLEHVVDIKSESIHHKAAPEDSFISFATSRAETPEALAGKHAPNMLIIADEASGIPDPVFVAASGSMSGGEKPGHNACTILAGNPVRTKGFFFETHHGQAHNWTTFHWTCEGHPRISEDFIRDMEERYGKGSNDYRVRVQGEFPRSDADAVIPYEVLQLALERDIGPTNTKPIWGLDVARKGGDRSALAKRAGNVLLEPVKSWKDKETMELCGLVMKEWSETPAEQRPDAICVDAIGLGAGVADRLRELGLPAFAINVSESPAFGDTYLNLKAELWHGKAREWFMARTCSLKGDKRLAAELNMPAIAYTSSGKLKVEGKDEVRKKNLDRRSPDLADAFVLTFAHQASQAMYGSEGSTNWKEPLQRNVTYV